MLQSTSATIFYALSDYSWLHKDSIKQGRKEKSQQKHLHMEALQKCTSSLCSDKLVLKIIFVLTVIIIAAVSTGLTGTGAGTDTTIMTTTIPAGNVV